MFPDEDKRQREWRRMAEALNIEIVEDEDLAADRRRRAMEKIEAEFG